MPEQLLSLARVYGIVKCCYCKYSLRCHRKKENNYGARPVDAMCSRSPTVWLDEEALLEFVRLHVEEPIQ